VDSAVIRTCRSDGAWRLVRWRSYKHYAPNGAILPRRSQRHNTAQIVTDDLLMPEVADAGKDHRHVPRVGGGDDFFVPNRAAGLNRAARARVGGCD
jgi:hypothetical protein